MGRKRRQTIRTLEERNEHLASKILDLETQLGVLHSEKESLEIQIAELKKAEEASRLTKTVKNVNEANSMVVDLYESTKTTPIMELFSRSDKEFLVFRHMFRLAPSWKYVSLIVAKNKADVKYHQSGLTMTDLKKVSRMHVSRNLISSFPSDDRLYPLFLELVRVGKKVESQGGLIRFDRPCLLGGQTYNDQTGFGWEYCGEKLVHRGKEYGETTKFLIIGVYADPNQ